MVLAAALATPAACGGLQTSTPLPPSTLTPGLSPAPSQLSGDTRVHDPSMLREDDTYYVFSTGDEYGLNQGTIQIRASQDLADWRLVGTVFPAIPDWVARELAGAPPNLWAPDISFWGGTYYLYYAGSRFGSNSSVIGLATNTTLDPDNPAYQWVDQGLVIRSQAGDNWNAIDPNLAFDAAGTPWLAFGSFWDGIKMRRIDPATGKLAGDSTLHGLASRGGDAIEAPAILFRDRFYYLFVSFDRCCRGADSTYKIMVGRSPDIGGPYLDRQGRPMAEGGGSLVLEGGNRMRGPGGQALLNDAGTYRLIYHAYDAFDLGTPRLQIRDLRWDAGGWPSVDPYPAS
jgi:arabinan endo-1,5-alpha-L-arabinosidase